MQRKTTFRFVWVQRRTAYIVKGLLFFSWLSSKAAYFEMAYDDLEIQLLFSALEDWDAGRVWNGFEDERLGALYGGQWVEEGRLSDRLAGPAAVWRSRCKRSNIKTRYQGEI